MPKCAEPKFEWIEEREWWSPCKSCGRLAWDHEQCDPLQDVRNAIKIAHDPSLDPRDFPPTMKSPE